MSFAYSDLSAAPSNPFKGRLGRASGVGAPVLAPLPAAYCGWDSPDKVARTSAQIKKGILHRRTTVTAILKR